MFVLHLVFVALLASSTGNPREIQGPWLITDENPQYEETDRQYLSEKDSVWSESPPEVVSLVPVEYQDMPTTPEPYDVKERAPDGKKESAAEGEDSAVWKIILVVAVLLVSIVGSLSLAYYMCVWRGGRIHYQPQKGNNA